jgi:hypothetical protein
MLAPPNRDVPVKEAGPLSRRKSGVPATVPLAQLPSRSMMSCWVDVLTMTTSKATLRCVAVDDNVGPASWGHKQAKPGERRRPTWLARCGPDPQPGRQQVCQATIYSERTRTSRPIDSASSRTPGESSFSWLLLCLIIACLLTGTRDKQQAGPPVTGSM